ncbi:MAG: LysE family translocator [Bacteroidales bacterium]|nr:LysE family translocator [Bacteroidales bacterium]
MDIQTLYSGVIIGLLAASPVGAVAILCMQKTIQRGFFHGWFMGVGSAFGDFVYAIIAGFGLTYISNFLIENRLVLGIVGGLLMIYLGLKVFRANPVEQWKQAKSPQSNKKNPFSGFATSFALTVSNPLTIIVFGTLFTASGSVNTPGFADTCVELLGVIIGAILWWTLLVSIVNIFRRKIGPRVLLWINKIMGISIMLFGISVMIMVIFFNDKL